MLCRTFICWALRSRVIDVQYVWTILGLNQSYCLNCWFALVFGAEITIWRAELCLKLRRFPDKTPQQTSNSGGIIGSTQEFTIHVENL